MSTFDIVMSIVAAAVTIGGLYLTSRGRVTPDDIDRRTLPYVVNTRKDRRRR